MPELPTLYVCHGDRDGLSLHPCRRVQEALDDKGIRYEKVIAGKGSPFPFLRKEPRDALKRATAAEKLPTLQLPDGAVLTNSRAILRWAKSQG